MKSSSGHEPALRRFGAGSALLFRLALTLAIFSAAPAFAVVIPPSLGEASRLVSSERVGPTEAAKVVRWYASLGLRFEAARFLEERVQLGDIGKAAAAPLFEELVAEQSRWTDGDRLVALCETALRSGAETPSIWYAYGSGLRAAGRLRDSVRAFGRIGPDSPLYPCAAFAIGQVASEAGDGHAAKDAFRRARELLENEPLRGDFERRLARSQAELFLATGNTSEALPLFETLGITDDDVVARLGREVAKADAARPEDSPSAESVARLPVRQKVLFLLLRGGKAGERGDFHAAAADLARADKLLSEFVSSKEPPAAGLRSKHEEIDRLERQMAAHATCRKRLNASIQSGDAAAIRNDVTELLAILLLLEKSVHRAALAAPRETSQYPIIDASGEGTEAILRRIEIAALGGSGVEEQVDALRKKLEVLENLAHPIRRYRLLSKLEGFQSTIAGMKRELALRRMAVPAADENGARDISAMIGELGRFLAVLEEFREAEAEARQYVGTNFDIFRKRVEPKPGSSASEPEWVGETLEFDGLRIEALSSRTRELRNRLILAAWAREKQRLLWLRPVVRRQLADALVGQARAFRGRPLSEWAPDSRSALERAISLLRAGGMTPRDRTEAAVNVASLLLQDAEEAEGSRPVRTKAERATMQSVLAALDGSSVRGARKEEALYLAALLRMETGDGAGTEAAREFLENYPGTAAAYDLAVRLGQEAFSAGAEKDAETYFRLASTGSSPAASQVARYMLGWIALRKGDAGGTLRELSPALASPGFPCEGRSPVEEALVTLATRSLERAPVESVLSFPPVRDGACVGKTLLAELARYHEVRGDAARSSALFVALAERHPAERDALTYERKAIQGLTAAGEEERALQRVRALGEKFGPDSGWARQLPEPARERALEEIRGVLTETADRYFDKGIRSKEKAVMTAAADLLERLFALEENGRESGDRELRLKWAVASLQSGAREQGLALLQALLKEEGDDTAGERAAFLFAETMLSGYERGSRTADDAAAAMELLLHRSSSPKAAGTALGAAASFLKKREYAHAAGVAKAVEASAHATGKERIEAALVRSEAALFLNDFPAARELAESILGDAASSESPGILGRAKDLVLLSTLKEIEAREKANEWGEAAALLAEIGRRFTDKPETPLYLDRAVRAYRLAGDKEAVLRVGLLFLERFPGRKESPEIAGIVGALLEEREKAAEAAELYADVGGRHLRSAKAPDLLFRAACLSQERGDRHLAKKRFLEYRDRYSAPRWRTIYATLSLGLLSWGDGDEKKAVRELTAGLKRLNEGVEPGASPKLFEIAGRANVAIGEYWAERFRKTKLVLPLDRSLETKGKLFRRSLAAFEQAERDAPAGVALRASQLSGDLFVEFGDSLLASQRPKGMNREERNKYEEGLRSRADLFFERALDRYAAALERVDKDAELGQFAVPVRGKIERTKIRLAENSSFGEARK